METQKTALTVDEAAKFTGLSRNYIYKLAHQKRISYFKPNGGRLFFKKDDLEKFLFRNRQPAEFEGGTK